MRQLAAKGLCGGFVLLMLLWVPIFAQGGPRMMGEKDLVPQVMDFDHDRYYAALDGGQIAAAQGASKEVEPAEEEEGVTIADPIEPWNRLMFTFNDRLYFWALKPAARGYSFIMPEMLRVAFRDLFYNLRMPMRFVNCLLQLKIEGAGMELGRFLVNTTVGIGGLFDPASQDPELQRHDEDLDQTLGVYGVGQGLYIVWPFLGPSSLRGTVGLAGDYLLDPLTYVNESFLNPVDYDLGAPQGTSTGIRVFELINAVSLRIGDYEDLKKAALDPYIALRDAYVQNRKKKVEE